MEPVPVTQASAWGDLELSRPSGNSRAVLGFFIGVESISEEPAIKPDGCLVGAKKKLLRGIRSLA